MICENGDEDLDRDRDHGIAAGGLSSGSRTFVQTRGCQ